MSRKMNDEDWQNLRLQLKALVDVYCEMNDDIYKIKDLLKKIVKYIKTSEKKVLGRKLYLPKATKGKKKDNSLP